MATKKHKSDEEAEKNASDLKLTRVPDMKTGMLIRKPSAEVFNALVDPAITTKIWFTKSSGKLEAGKQVKWEWEMYGVSANVDVKEIEANKKIVASWGPEPLTFEIRFIPHLDNTATYVQVTERGYAGNGDQILNRIVDSCGGWTTVLNALKTLLEHNVAVSFVGDKHPKGLKLE